MKKLLLLLLVVVSAAVQARPIGEDKATEIARKFALEQKKTVIEKPAAAKPHGVLMPETPATYYLYNMVDGQGFVIISGDDRTEAVLGYSDNGYIDEDNMPSGLKYMLACHAKTLKYMDSIGLMSVDDGNDDDEGEEEPVDTDNPRIKPMLTTKWAQGDPFNSACPLIGGEHALTGCVATATAQVMRYQQYPEVFNWEEMKDVYEEGDDSDDAKEVARLMAQIGQYVGANYGLDGTSASTLNVQKALAKYGYKSVRAIRYDKTIIDSLLYSELKNNRPVIIGGQPMDGSPEGHAFICDGYDHNGYFHINWGWAGYCDGYYRLGALVPLHNEQYIGSDYSNDQTIVCGIAPGDFDVEEWEYTPICNDEKDVTLSVKELTYNEISKGGAVDVVVKMTNEGPAFRGKLSLVVASADHKSQNVVGVDLREGETVAFTFSIKMVNLGLNTLEVALGKKKAETIFMNVVDQVVVELEEPGTLSAKLGDAINSINSIKISGPMNGDDIVALRQMLKLGVNELLDFQHVDMEDATIVDGGTMMWTNADCLPDQMLYPAFSLYTFIAPKNLKEIGAYTFSNCQNLKVLKLPETLKKIGALAFLAVGLEEISIPDSVEFIDQQCFAYCTTKKIHLSKNLNHIGVAPFYGASELEEIELPAVVPPVYDNWGISLKHSDAKLYVPYASVAAYKNDANWGAFEVLPRSYSAKGDVNADGEVDMIDANLITDYFLGTVEEEGFDVEAADVNGDGKVNIADANAILMQLNDE